MQKHLTMFLLAVLAAGCQPKYTEPVVAPTAMTPEQKQFDALWQASRRVLKRYDFRIDRQNPRAGVITTWPIVGKQLVELWRKDAASKTDAAESTLQTIYRSVKVTIRKTEGPERFQPTVEVFVSRSNKPTHAVSTTSDAYNLVTKRRKKRTLTG